MKRFYILFFAVILSAIVSAQSVFELRYAQAMAKYNEGKYSSAIEIIDHALSDVSGLSAQQKQQLENLRGNCRREISRMNTPALSRRSLESVSSLGQADTVYITNVNGRRWTATSSTEWIEAVCIDNMVCLRVLPNDLEEIREGSVSVSFAGGNSVRMQISQDARPKVARVVRINPTPANSRILVDGETVFGTGVREVVLGAGEHRVTAEHNMYESFDTTFVIPLAVSSDAIVIKPSLVMEFSTVAIDIASEDGEYIPSPRLTVDDIVINLKEGAAESLDESKRVKFYNLYRKDGIALPSNSIHKFLVQADGYEDLEFSRLTVPGEKFSMEAILKHKSGLVSFIPSDEADSSIVSVDNKKIGMAPLDRVRLKEGYHLISFEKDGYLSSVPDTVLEVKYGGVYTISFDMVRYDTFVFDAPLPEGTMVSLDGAEGTPSPCSIKVTRGFHNLTFIKPGYFTHTEKIKVAGNNITREFPVVLQPSSPVTFVTDEKDIAVKVFDAEGKFVAETTVGTKTEIPFSSDRYKVECFRDNGKRAFRGGFRFKDEKHSTYKFKTWSSYIFQIIGVGYNAYGGYTIPVNSKVYNELVDLSVGKLQIFKGLSSSILRGKVFLSEDRSKLVLPSSGYSYGGAMDLAVIPALSCVLLNADFRMGGALAKWLDMDMLASYAWYPDLTKFLPLTHLSGHDLFLGLEFATRLPVFTMEFKIGYHTLMSGASHIYTPSEYGNISDVEKRFYNEEYGGGFKDGQLVFGVGFSLGGKKSKGNNMVRIF